MGSTTTLPGKSVVNRPAVQPGSGAPTKRAGAIAQATGSQSAPKPAGYGLPCATCMTYYSADLTVCPVCNGSDRVAAPAAQSRMPVSPIEQIPDPTLLEQERERFFQEFNAQLPFQTADWESAGRRCIRDENHNGEFASAAVCEDCYEQLQQRADVLEAALHMDLREAAQIVYDAVWADPSDPTLTYKNAAHALLNELRKRSGLFTRFTLFSQQTMAD
jgi:hypothetical protein